MAKKHRSNRKGPNNWHRSLPKRERKFLPKGTSPRRYKTWREAAGQRETAVKLEKLPPGVAFPETFTEPIAYDADRQLLLYRGPMTHDSYAALRLLSGEPAYLAALDQLRETTCRIYAQPAAGHPLRHWWPWLLILAALLFVALTILVVVGYIPV